jgi:PHD/YefM family antitoxin component YafN of YafNO toxin-antitoxin module
MKILEAQAAVLTNVEVYQFLKKQAEEYQEQKRRGPGNLETLRREVSQSCVARAVLKAATC